MFEITYGEGVVASLKELSAFQCRTVLDKIDEQLTHEPTRNKKVLVGLDPPWEHENPIWELRVGEYRVFYDVDEDAQRVLIHAIRHKPPHKTTEEIL